MAAMRNHALLVLVLACVHEFAWQFLPDGLGLQGNLRAVTQCPLIVALLFGVSAMARERFVSAVCVAVAIMSSTTALGSVWWFLARWDAVPNIEHFSRQAAAPMLLLSAVAALAVFWRWDDGRG